MVSEFGDARKIKQHTFAHETGLDVPGHFLAIPRKDVILESPHVRFDFLDTIHCDSLTGHIRVDPLRIDEQS